MDKKVMVSVFCVTYNHEKYIRAALEGIVMQKTNFRFEVLVHDDASKDRTAEIVREFEEKYPDIIKPIYQSENQYSKGIKIPPHILLPRAKGKYLAWCEGDDRWTDPHKLQKQFDYMESHPECALCLHRAVKHWCVPGGEDSVGPEQDNDRDYSVAEIMGRELFFATASFFLRADQYRAMPELFITKTCGDIPIQIYASICGKVHCFQDIMAVYNYRTEGSFTKKFFDDHSKKIAHNRDVIEMLRQADMYYNYQYTNELAQGIRYHEFHLYKHTGELEKIGGTEYDRYRTKDKERLEKLEKIKNKLRKAGVE